MDHSWVGELASTWAFCFIHSFVQHVPTHMKLGGLRYCPPLRELGIRADPQEGTNLGMLEPPKARGLVELQAWQAGAGTSGTGLHLLVVPSCFSQFFGFYSACANCAFQDHPGLELSQRCPQAPAAVQGSCWGGPCAVEDFDVTISPPS